MFGYITVNQEELKVKDLKKYQGYYCGLCKDLKEYSGERSRMTLTYDMTFLAILLTGLYEKETREENRFCILHPFHKKLCIRNDCTRYAADMNVLLTYHNLMDDWEDEKKFLSLSGARMLRRAYRAKESQYPRQIQAIENYLQELHKAEAERSENIDLAAGLTGRCMAEIFVMEEDEWSSELRRIGFFLGKFIYLIDAYDDVKKDQKTGNYNPFEKMAEEADFQDRAREILLMMAAEASRAFETLPILENVDILRNILYSGIWERFEKIRSDQMKTPK